MNQALGRTVLAAALLALVLGCNQPTPSQNTPAHDNEWTGLVFSTEVLDEAHPNAIKHTTDKTFEIGPLSESQTLVLTIGNRSNTPVIIQNGGFECLSAQPGARPSPIELVDYRFECMRCPNFSSCSLKVERSDLAPQTGCVFEQGPTLYQVSGQKAALFRAHLKPTERTDFRCRLRLVGDNETEWTHEFELQYT